MSSDLDSDHKTVLAVFGERQRPVNFYLVALQRKKSTIFSKL